jgi:hypothetical protein
MGIPPPAPGHAESAMPDPLATELATFNKLLPSLMKSEGKYALIIGEHLIDIYSTYEDAVKVGYAKAKLDPFLVKKIAGVQSVANFSRDVGNSCLISPIS